MTSVGKNFDLTNHSKYTLYFAVFGLIFIYGFSNCIFAQSTNQNTPTPLLTNEISGQIKARDIGDSRLTTYYFILNGERGDVFVNVVTNNFNGDFDIFTADTLQPRTKITVYADTSNVETGRVVYMRKPEKLILRVQGRTPNDDPATFQIKFAGSFQPINAAAVAEDTNNLPEIKIDREGTVRVNSVGTILEEPKTDTGKKSDLDIEKRVEVADSVADDKSNIPETFDPTKRTDRILPEDNSISNPNVETADNNSAEKTDDTVSDIETRELTVNIEEKPTDTSATIRIEKVEEDADAENTEAEEEETARLSKISLKLELKNGDKFERSMNEVININVIKTVLTIVTSDGNIHEFSIFEVAKMTIN